MAYLQLFEDARDWAEKPMNYFERLFDLFIDRLIAITDYFIFSKQEDYSYRNADLVALSYTSNMDVICRS